MYLNCICDIPAGLPGADLVLHRKPLCFRLRRFQLVDVVELVVGGGVGGTLLVAGGGGVGGVVGGGGAVVGAAPVGCVAPGGQISRVVVDFVGVFVRRGHEWVCHRRPPHKIRIADRD